MTLEERLTHQRHAKTLGTEAVEVIFKDTLQTETENFANILAVRGDMSQTQVED